MCKAWWAWFPVWRKLEKRMAGTAILNHHVNQYMPTIQIRDITLLERLNKIKPTPTDYYDDVLYELLRKSESKGECKPTIKGLDDLPRLVVEEVRKALNGQLVEAIRAALLPAISNLSLEVPVELSVKVKLRLEPVLELHGDSPARDDPPNNTTAVGDVLSDKTRRTLELATLEQRVIEYLRQQGGCFEGSVGDLLRVLDIEDPKRSLRYRLYNRLRVDGGRVCLPEAAVK